jgi:hypothetical protein
MPWAVTLLIDAKASAFNRGIPGHRRRCLRPVATNAGELATTRVALAPLTIA